MRDPDLDPIFAPVREIPADESFPQVRAWIARVDARDRAGSRAHAAAHHRSPRVRRLVLAGITGALFAGACALPVDQEQTVAYVLTGRIALPPAQAKRVLRDLAMGEPATSTILGEVMIRNRSGQEEVAAYVESGEATVDGVKIITPTSKFAIVLPAMHPRRAIEWERALAAGERVLGVDRQPVQETVRRPVYQFVLRSFEFRVNAALSEQEVEVLVQKHLDGLLPGQVRVTHTTARDGKRAITLTGSGTLPAEEGERVDAFLREAQGLEADRLR